jgi:rod shape-determining protein MreD
MPQVTRGVFTIYFSFLIALMLSVMPLPDNLQWWRPEWVLLILLYWIVAFPDRIGIGTAWVVGLLLDVLEGNLLGMNAFSLTVVAYVAQLSYQRIQMFAWPQQVLTVFFLVALNQLIGHWIKGVLGVSVQTLMFLLPAIVSALLWPWVFVILRGIKRRYHVH